ncbi:hypothetical protein ACE6H2_000653 [Prunus campanulata]
MCVAGFKSQTIDMKEAAKAGKAYGLGRSTSVQNTPRVSRNSIISVLRSCPEELQKLPDVGTSLNIDHVSEVSPLQQNTKKRRVMFDPIDDGEVKPTVADNMASFRDVPVMADYSFEGEKSNGEDVPIASWSEKQVDLGDETQVFASHGPPSQKEKVQKG